MANVNIRRKRFVLLRHELPTESSRASHFDLMIEGQRELWTWEISSFPTGDCELAAKRLPDHRLAYLDYEGPVSGNRGFVKRVDHGLARYDDDLGQDSLVFSLEGTELSGQMVLRRIGGDRWRLNYRPTKRSNA